MENLLLKTKSFVNKNASTILTCVGGAGVVATSVLAVKATPKAMALLENAKEEKGEELTKSEAVLVAGPAYIPAILTGAATIACLFGANALNKRQQAASQKIRAEIAKDKYVDCEICGHGDKRLFYDEFSGRYFESTMEDVITAQYALNRMISLNGGAYLNEWYEELGIEGTDYGAYLGWSSGLLMDAQWADWLEFGHEKTLIDDDLECIIITFSLEPMVDFEYY